MAISSEVRIESFKVQVSSLLIEVLSNPVEVTTRSKFLCLRNRLLWTTPELMHDYFPFLNQLYSHCVSYNHSPYQPTDLNFSSPDLRWKYLHPWSPKLFITNQIDSLITQNLLHTHLKLNQRHLHCLSIEPALKIFTLSQTYTKRYFLLIIPNFFSIFDQPKHLHR